MGFFKKLKYTLGFGTEGEYDEDPSATRQCEPDCVRDTVPRMPDVVDANTNIDVADEVMLKIFDKVVEVTNAAMPDYFKASVNPDRQKKYLFDSLDASVKEYLAALDAQSQARCMALWQKERDELQRQMEALKQRAADLEAKRVEMNEQRLSSDRQRRALSERVHDLEAKVITLEAEKEQFEIENLSLINKAKVASVYESDMEAMRQELEAFRKASSSNGAKAEIERLNNEVECLKEENTRLKDACEAAKVKDQMNETMLNSLQKRASESIQTAKDSDKRIDELAEEIAAKDAQIADLTNQIEVKDARLAEDEQAFEEYEKIAEQLEEFETLKEKYEEKIAALKADLTRAQDEITALRTVTKVDAASKTEKPVAPKPAAAEPAKSAPIAGSEFSFDDDML